MKIKLLKALIFSVNNNDSPLFCWSINFFYKLPCSCSTSKYHKMAEYNHRNYVSSQLPWSRLLKHPPPHPFRLEIKKFHRLLQPSWFESSLSFPHYPPCPSKSDPVTARSPCADKLWFWCACSKLGWIWSSTAIFDYPTSLHTTPPLPQSPCGVSTTLFCVAHTDGSCRAGCTAMSVPTSQPPSLCCTLQVTAPPQHLVRTEPPH